MIRELSYSLTMHFKAEVEADSRNEAIKEAIDKVKGLFNISVDVEADAYLKYGEMALQMTLPEPLKKTWIVCGCVHLSTVNLSK